MTPIELNTILTSIRDIVHAEVAPLQEAVGSLDQRLTKVDSAVSLLDQRLSKVGNTVSLLEQSQIKLENTVKSLDQRLGRVEIQSAELKQDLTRRLDEIYDAIQEVMGELDTQSDQKVAKLRNDLGPRLTQLEQLHPSGQHPSV